MRILLSCLLTFGLLAIGYASEQPVFPEQYTVHGVILVPYAELREPFAAYYDGVLNRSRIDYYGDLLVTLQKSPAAEKNPEDGYGSLYKIAYEADLAGNAKKVCFKASGSEGSIVHAQSVIPNLDGFVKVGTVRCPIEDVNEFKEGSIKSKIRSFNQVVHTKLTHPSSCELWRKKESLYGEKTNTYSFYLKHDPKTGDPIPFVYEMQGYNNLLGAHYDHYIIHYTNFRDGLINEEMFSIDSRYPCGPFPGPGKKGTKKLLMNPIAAYFDTTRKAYNEHFEQFKKDHNKLYDTEFEHEHRRKLFLDNSRFIIGMNRRNPGFTLAINHLADKSEDELKILRGVKITKKHSNGGLAFREINKDKENSTLPPYFDWRLYGAVNPVKDQSICGSCWSFGTSGTLEGTYFVKTGHLIRLSEQQLIDCSWPQGNNGCDGGEDFRVYNYLMRSGGIALADDYGKYLGTDGKCHANDVKKTVKISGFVNVTKYDVEDLKRALVENGPVTIAINADVKTFTFYSHGVYDDSNCIGDDDHLDHQVLLVGYGTLNGKDYWLVKNSWSTLWGNDGYILIAQKDNICGVTTQASYPIIDV